MPSDHRELFRQYRPRERKRWRGYRSGQSDRVGHDIAAGRVRRQDGSMRPMLATHTETVPCGPEWAHEVKWDGMRVLADARGGGLTLTSRTERDVTSSFPELVPLADLVSMP